MAVYPIGIFSAMFHVISASSGTGFSTINFGIIPEKAKLLFIFLMFLGGMGFSTAGGIKIYRAALFLKSVPYAIGICMGKEQEKVEFDGTDYDRKEIVTNLVFILLSIILMVGTGVLISFSGFGIIDSMFESASAFGTVGLSAGIATTYLATHLKLALITLMVVGRVEVLPLLVAMTTIKEEHSYPEVPVGSPVVINN